MGFAKGPVNEDTANTIVRHTERIIETPIFKDVVIEKPVFAPVTIERPVFVNKTIEVQNVKVNEIVKEYSVDRIKYNEVVVDRVVYKDVVVERPVIKPVTVEVVQKVPKIEYETVVVKVEKVEYVTVQKQIEVPEIVTRTTYVDRPVYQDRIFIREKYRYSCEKCGHVHEEIKTT